MSLSKQVIKSGFWLQLSRLIQLGSNFIVSTILARILLPADFGLAGIVTLYGAFVGQFTTLGLTLAIIQKKEISQEQLSTIFWINLGFNIFTALAIAGSAPLAVRYYHKPELLPLILLYTSSFFIMPFFQVHRRLLEKGILFERIARIEVASCIGSGLISIAMALAGFGVYSIVWQMISLNLIYLITTRMAVKWRPDFVCKPREVRDLIFFSLKMKGARLLSFVERNIDFIILSKLFDATLFGFYSLAYRIMYFPVRRISYVFTEILFPAFSSIQEDLDRVRNAYLRSVQIVAMSVMPLSVVLGEFSRPLIIFLIGKKWLPIADLLFFLSIAGLLQAMEVVGDSLYPALNKPQTLILLQVVRTVLTGIAVFLGGLKGLFAVAVAILISRVLLFLLSLHLIKKIVAFSYWDFLKKMLGPLVACGAMFLVVLPFKAHLIHTKLNLGIVLILGLLAYCGTILATNFKDLQYIYLKLKAKA